MFIVFFKKLHFKIIFNYTYNPNPEKNYSSLIFIIGDSCNKVAHDKLHHSQNGIYLL